jgi:hypothetical protein
MIGQETADKEDGGGARSHFRLGGACACEASRWVSRRNGILRCGVAGKGKCRGAQPLRRSRVLNLLSSYHLALLPERLGPSAFGVGVSAASGSRAFGCWGSQGLRRAAWKAPLTFPHALGRGLRSVEFWLPPSRLVGRALLCMACRALVVRPWAPYLESLGLVVTFRS